MYLNEHIRQTHIMKRINLYIFLLIGALALLPLLSYSQWTWQNPLPQGNSVLNLHFLNEEIGYVVGNNGTILKTINGGASWIHQKSNTNLNLTSVHMTSENTGFIVGGNKYSDDSLSIILKTTNGGVGWNIVNQDSLGAYSSVYCASTDTIFVAGKNGRIIKSVNSGINWTSLTTGISDNIVQIKFPTTSIGYAIADSCRAIKTTDGGISWEQININITSPAKLTSMSFPNELIGYILVCDSGPGLVLKTINGGATWLNVLLQTPTPNSIDFCSPEIGYVAAAGSDYKTTNGGQTWETVTSCGFWAAQIDLINSEIAYSAIGSEIYSFRNPVIRKTTNGGMSWNYLTSSVTYGYISEIDFPEDNIGYALSQDWGSAIILKTTDGFNWDTTLSLEKKITDMNVLNRNTIWFCGDYYDTLYENIGVFGRSSDGGQNWEISDLNPNMIPKSIYNTSNSVGYLLTYDGLYKTINSGIDWQKIHSDTTMNLFRVYFSSANIGYILKNSYDYSFSSLIKTTDAGSTWEPIKQFNNQLLKSIFFLNNEYGFIITDGYPDSYFHTTSSGGSSWIMDTIKGISINNIYFINDSIGCIIGSSGEILQTKDGGEIWHLNNMVTDNSLSGVFFINEDLGYLSGNRGTILYTDSCITRINEHSFEQNNSPLWIFPNPSSDKTNITYSLEETSQVRLEIINLSGQCLKTMVDSKQDKGMYKYSLDTLPYIPGVYIVRLRINNISHTRIAIIK